MKAKLIKTGDEFGFIPNDGRMPKVSKCSRCGKNYA